MRWLAILLLPVVLLFAVACEEETDEETPRSTNTAEQNADIDVGPILDAYSFLPELEDSLRDLLATGRDLHGLNPDQAVDAMVKLAATELSFDALLGYLFLSSIDGVSPQDATAKIETCLPSPPEDLFFVFVPLFEVAEDPAADEGLQEFASLIDTCS